MQHVTRYALEREGHGRFCPENEAVVGFGSETEAMLHALTFMPNEAHLWHWVPISGADSGHAQERIGA